MAANYGIKLAPQPMTGRLSVTELVDDYLLAYNGARLREATQLFWEKGYHGASMQDIGERVGMLKGSLYAHLSNKEEILLEIVSTTFRRLMDAVSPLLEMSMPATERFRLSVRAHAAIVLGDPAAASMFFYESRHLTGEPASWTRDAHHRYMSVWEKLLQTGVDSGEFRPDLDVKAIALLAISIGDWAERVPGSTGPDVATLADRLGEVLLLGCCSVARPEAQSTFTPRNSPQEDSGLPVP